MSTMGPRVIDFSTHLSGPLASHYLTELGADVIKVEHWRVGDGTRGTSPLINGVGMIHVNCGPGVRSLAADLRSENWPTLVEACVRWADVVVVGSRPADAARRGLDFDTIRSVKSDIVYCSITGYGEDGPWAGRPGHGLQIDAYAGHVPVEWHEGQPRVPRGFRTAGTTGAAIFAAMGIFAALAKVRAGAGAQHVQSSAWEAAMSWQWRDLTTEGNLGRPWTEYSESGTRYAMYATRDERALLLCPLEKRFWAELCDVLGLPDLKKRGDWSGSGMDWGVGPEYAGERGLLEQRIIRHDLDHWIEVLSRTDVPFAPMLTPSEALGSHHAQAVGVQGLTAVNGEPTRFTRAGIRIVDPQHPAPTVVELSEPPAIGQHSAEVLDLLGIPGLVVAPAQVDHGTSLSEPPARPQAEGQHRP